MYAFTVSDMTCGHCAMTIEKTAKSIDSAAVVTVDLAAHAVTIDSGVPANAFAKAIAEAGYTPHLRG